MSSREIEDVLASIRRLVSDDLRPANRPHAAGALLLTPALRIVTKDDSAALARPVQASVAPVSTIRPDWVPDQSTVSAVSDIEAEHLDFQNMSARTAMADAARAPLSRTAMESAAEAFHAHDDEFVLSLSDTGSITLRGDGARHDGVGAPAIVQGQGHGAVFAVLTHGAAPVRVPATAELIDAEGGAPVEDDAPWAVVDWDDPMADPSARDIDTGEVDVASEAKPISAMDVAEAKADATLEPLVLPFVSMRRAMAAAMPDAPAASDPLVLRGAPVLNEPVTNEAVSSGLAAVEPVLSEPVVSRTESLAPLELVDGLIVPEDVPEAERFWGDRAMADIDDADLVVGARDRDPQSDDMAQENAAVTAADTSVATPAQQDRVAEAVHDVPAAPDEIAAPQAGPAPAPSEQAGVGLAPTSAATVRVKKAHLRFTEAPKSDLSSGQDDIAITNVFDAPDLVPPAAEVTPVAADATEPVLPAASLQKSAARLSDAAFTRWPGWAQSASDEPPEAAANEIAPAPAPELPVAAPPRKKHKIPPPDVSWADAAEAEIHRQLAAELGLVAMNDIVEKIPDMALSQGALRDLVRSTIREELAGKLGERITANVRKLVQMELQKTLAVQVTEFRSQRRDPHPES